MVWIHGGGFIGGTATIPVYYGQPLVAVGDVIVVSIQYRLNVFGYLTTGKGRIMLVQRSAEDDFALSTHVTTVAEYALGTEPYTTLFRVYCCDEQQLITALHHAWTAWAIKASFLFVTVGIRG